MLIILSPAKTMDMSTVPLSIPATEPVFKSEAEQLAHKMQKFSVKELEKILKISPKLAEMNFTRYQQFDQISTPSKQAVLAYNGSVFKEMRPMEFSKADFNYAQEHLRMISTLYGLVRPLDLIKAYRIAFSLKFGNTGGEELYDFWLPKLTEPLIEDVQKSGGILVNLASLDVLKALKMEEIKKQVQVISPEFQVFRNGKYETIRTYAKLARGAMARHIILNRIDSAAKLRSFEWEGFKINEKLSDGQKYVYIR